MPVHILVTDIGVGNILFGKCTFAATLNVSVCIITYVFEWSIIWSHRLMAQDQYDHQNHQRLQQEDHSTMRYQGLIIFS